jgi:hypothetical protein
VLTIEIDENISQLIFRFSHSNLKKYERCYLPEVQTQCGVDGLTVNQDFLNRIYTAYQCSNQFANCPTA